MGEDLGTFPGGQSEKLEPWMKGYVQNFEFLAPALKLGRNGGGSTNWYEQLQKFADMQPVSYMRGQTLPAQFIIIDEVQNLTPAQLKTLITRAGKGAKVVIMGDIDQIDIRETVWSNGLSNFLARQENFWKEALRVGELSAPEHSLVGVTRLTKSERSPLSDYANRIYKDR